MSSRLFICWTKVCLMLLILSDGVIVFCSVLYCSSGGFLVRFGVCLLVVYCFYYFCLGCENVVSGSYMRR